MPVKALATAPVRAAFPEVNRVLVGRLLNQPVERMVHAMVSGGEQG